MILNDFKCEACEVVSEIRYKYEDREKLACPACDSPGLSLLLSAPAVATLNTRSRVEDALKKRTVKDHNDNKESRREAQKAKHPKLFSG